MSNGWVYPVCNVGSGLKGPFVSDWAVACHLAGKAKSRDAAHIWVGRASDVYCDVVRDFPSPSGRGLG